ncbi:LysR substrate-binding domain-containing protein [Bacteriovoracaceae bacterium]|nr:LysR substrate-binding domain-containing protein [Bacteriovoracaceae bacterium]
MHESITEEIPHASRRVYIGVSNEIAHTFVVEVISHFLNKYSPRLRPKVMMTSGSHQKLVEKLKFREIDVLVSQNSAKSFEITNLQKIEVPVNLICTINKKLSPQKRYLNISDAIKLLNGTGPTRWVVPSPHFKLRAEINNYFEENMMKADIVFESDVMESITRSVVDEVGVSFLPLIYVPEEIKNKSLYAFGPKKGYPPMLG